MESGGRSGVFKLIQCHQQLHAINMDRFRQDMKSVK